MTATPRRTCSGHPRGGLWLLGCTLIISLGAGRIAQSQELATSSFDGGAEGWEVVDFPSPDPGDPPVPLATFSPTWEGSISGGTYIEFEDPSGNWFWFSAPAKFLGDKSPAFRGAISLDIRVVQDPGDFAPTAPLLILVGSGITLYANTTWPNDTFTHFEVPLLPEAWSVGHYTTGPPATAVEMQAVLQDLDALYVSGDWINGVVETAALDDVRLFEMTHDDVSSFDSGPEGWVVVDYPGALGDPPELLNAFPPTYHAEGGNPGGFISADDPSGDWFWFSAPPGFLGDQSRFLGGSIAFDMAVDLDVSGDPPSPAVALTGAGIVLVAKGLPPLEEFTSFQVPLVPSVWRVGDSTTGPVASSAQLQAVLEDLEHLYISGDWFDDPDETAALDNVHFEEGVPIPALSSQAHLLLVLALLGVLMWSGRPRFRRESSYREVDTFGWR